MKKYEENKSQLNGILIKSSDMSYELKFQITQIIRAYIQKFSREENEMNKISASVTTYLQQKYPGPWICAIGKRFTANIVHQPGYFMRANTEDYHIMVMQLKKRVPIIKQTKEQRRKNRKVSFIQTPQSKNYSQDSYANNPIANLMGFYGK